MIGSYKYNKARHLYANPIIAGQVWLSGVFEGDYVLRHRMPAQHTFIGENRFYSFREGVTTAKRCSGEVILSVGDSSTTGWDSNKVPLQYEVPVSALESITPFFHHVTYSDVLRRALSIVNPQVSVLNAGVPGHTSAQGVRYLREMLGRLRASSIRPAFTVLHYGNNDSCWNDSIADADLLPASATSLTTRAISLLTEHWPGLLDTIMARSYMRARSRTCRAVKTRVGTEAFAAHIEAMIRICTSFGSIPILIVPKTPLRWAPGRRNERDELRWASGGALAIAGNAQLQLRRAEKSFTLGVELADLGPAYSRASDTLLEVARELDILIPRIKWEYQAIIRQIASDWAIPIVDLQINEKDASFFVDYCHPSEKLHRLIATALRRRIIASADHATTLEKIRARCTRRKGQVEPNAAEHNVYPLY